LPTGPQSSAALSKYRLSAPTGRSAECPAGVEPACPVWKTDAWAARPRARFVQRKGMESNHQGSSLVPFRAGRCRPSASPSVFSVWMAGFEPAWSGFRGRRMNPGSPTSRTSGASSRPTKKARGRVTPGLLGIRPKRFGVTVAEGRRPAPSAGSRPGPLRASDYHKSSRDCVPSCPLFRPPVAAILLPLAGVSVADIL
jgi:hypothetical protein